jgi:hypothetical protein
VRKFKGGHDLNYLKFAAEEHLNDSELIKGIGRVPVNQQIPEPIRPVEDKPWELPTNAWALKDGKYLLQKMVSSDLTINNLTILQCKPFRALLSINFTDAAANSRYNTPFS